MKRVSRPLGLTATCATAALVGASLIVPGAAQAATTETFVDGTGGVVAGIPFDWTVPAGVTSIEVVADGAGGGGGYYYPGSPLDPAGTGGSGARVTASLTVTPGQVLVLTVGGPGVGGDITASAGGTGGNASSVADKMNPTDASVLTIAGGGGGGGGANVDGSSGSAGGNGGGVAGAGESGQTLSMTVDGGGGGSGGVGGAGGTSVGSMPAPPNGQDGFAFSDLTTPGAGGSGQTCCGGGGGDGYGGGGEGGELSFGTLGGGAGGGAGGSISPNGTYEVSPIGTGGATDTPGAAGAGGRITLTYTVAPTPSPSPSASQSPGPSPSGSTSPSPSTSPTASPTTSPTATQTPTPTPTVKTTLKVDSMGRKATLGRRNVLVRAITTNGQVRSMQARCFLKGNLLRGRDARAVCDLRVRGDRVTAKPSCSTEVRMTVRVTARKNGASAKAWSDSWKVRGAGACRLPGTG